MTEAETTAERPAARRGGFGSLGSIIGLLVATWAAALASRPLNDNSFFTHLATGRLILEDGGVPSRDPYTFTALGEPWTVQSWLASVAYAGAERLGGVVGLRGLLVAVYVAAAWLLWRLTAPARSLLVRLLLVAGAMLVATGLWTERPYMVGVIGIAVVWLALDGRFPWWALVPVMWVWGNSHGSFVLGLALVVLVIAGGALDRRSQWRPLPVGERRVAVAVAVGTAAVAIGPLGLRALTFPLVAAERGDVFRHVTEWQAPAFRSSSELAYLVLVVVAIASMARRAREWRIIVPATAFIGASLYAQRNIVIATVVLVAVVAPILPPLGSLRGEDRPGVGRAAAALAGALLVVVCAATVATPALAVDDYAGRALAWIDRTGGADGRLATDVLNGNLLEVLDGADAAVFVDDRFDMLPGPIFEDYLTLLRGRPGVEQVLDEHGVGAVVWSRTDPLASILASSTGWRTAYTDARWVVFIRRGG